MAFASAFGMNAPVSLYGKLFSRVASHGVIVAGVSKINNPNYPLLAHEFSHSLEWLQSNLSAAIAASGAKGAPNMSRLVASGHSAGNHIMVQMLQDACQDVQAVVMLDPVDGVDPYGREKQYAIHPPAKVNFTVPALHIETGNDPVPAFRLGKLWPSCAPPLLSNARFYDAWRGPIWQVNATAFGHLDVCDPGIERTLAAPVCKEEFGQDSAPYRDMVADLIAAFIDGVVNGAFRVGLGGQGWSIVPLGQGQGARIGKGPAARLMR